MDFKLALDAYRFIHIEVAWKHHHLRKIHYRTVFSLTNPHTFIPRDIESTGLLNPFV